MNIFVNVSEILFWTYGINNTQKLAVSSYQWRLLGDKKCLHTFLGLFQKSYKRVFKSLSKNKIAFIFN